MMTLVVGLPFYHGAMTVGATLVMGLAHASAACTARLADNDRGKPGFVESNFRLLEAGQSS